MSWVAGPKAIEKENKKRKREVPKTKKPKPTIQKGDFKPIFKKANELI